MLLLLSATSQRGCSRLVVLKAISGFAALSNIVHLAPSSSYTLIYLSYTLIYSHKPLIYLSANSALPTGVPLPNRKVIWLKRNKKQFNMTGSKDQHMTAFRLWFQKCMFVYSPYLLKLCKFLLQQIWKYWEALIFCTPAHDISHKFLLLPASDAKIRVFWWEIGRCMLCPFFPSNIFQTRDNTQIVANEHSSVQHAWNFWNDIHTVTSSSEPWIWCHSSGKTFPAQTFQVQ